VTYKKC